MGRKILFITTDQQRYDCARLQRRHDRAHAGRRRAGRRAASTTGGPTTRTRCACRPARRCSRASTCARTAWSPTASRCPTDAPSDRRVPARQGRLPHRAARQGPLRARLRPAARSGAENRDGAEGHDRSVPRLRARRAGDARAPRSANVTLQHYGRWLDRQPRLEAPARLLRRCSRPSRAATPARPRRRNNPIPREWYHTDWVADRTIA